MKKLLLPLIITGLAVVGLTTASAQYYGSYDYGAYSYDNTTYSATGYTNTSYTSYDYPEMSSQSYYGGRRGGNYYGNYGGGIGSYTIGCTTYYYNTRTGAQLYTSYICNTYQYTQPTYYYPTYPYTYPSNQYCTYGYQNGNWHQCQSYSWFDNSYNNGYQNYLNCYYDQYGRYICY
jgi:hypothetical protein